MAEQNNNGQQQDLNQLLKVRREKLQNLQEAGKDPFVITKYKGLDPEIANGVDNNPYPRPISFQVGVNFNF